MRLVGATLRELAVPLKEPFATSFGVERRRSLLLVALHDAEGRTGWGECVASREPLYSSECTATARWMIGRRLLPWLDRNPSSGPASFVEGVRMWKGHRMAKAAVEAALWDLAAQEARRPLGEALGGPGRRRIRVGVSVGLQRSPAALVDRVGRYLEDGYTRIKLKVRPGADADNVRAVRRAYPEIDLWVDANQAYPTTAGRAIRRWATDARVAQVEQPFSERAIRAHAALQARAPFRVCLDESVVDADGLEDALAARALRSLNVKPARVGGLGPGLALAERARSAGVSAWVGGMLETGVGRAALVHLSSRRVFDLPGDVSASDRYFAEDLLERPFALTQAGELEVPRGPGLGVRVDDRLLCRYTVRSRPWRFGASRSGSGARSRADK